MNTFKWFYYIRYMHSTFIHIIMLRNKKNERNKNYNKSRYNIMLIVVVFQVYVIYHLNLFCSRTGHFEGTNYLNYVGHFWFRFQDIQRDIVTAMLFCLFYSSYFWHNFPCAYQKNKLKYYENAYKKYNIFGYLQYAIYKYLYIFIPVLNLY